MEIDGGGVGAEWVRYPRELDVGDVVQVTDGLGEVGGGGGGRAEHGDDA